MVEHTLHTVCPICGHQTDRASDAIGDGPGPTPGAVALCIRCGHWATYDQALDLRKLTPHEYRDVHKDGDCLRIQFAWLLAIGGNPPPEKKRKH